MHQNGRRRRWLVGRSRSLEPRALRDVERLADGTWRVKGPWPLVGLVTEDGGPVPSGDLRLELGVTAVAATAHPSLAFDTGTGFVPEQHLPLPEARTGSIRALVSLPKSTVALGLNPGPVRTFQLGTLRSTELALAGAVWAHSASHLRRLVRQPAQLGLLLVRASRLLFQRGPRGVLERLRTGSQRHVSEEGYGGWVRRYASLSEEQSDQLRARLAAFPLRPTVSLLLAPGPFSEELLEPTLASLECQIYPNWELCLAEHPASERLRAALARFAGTPRVRWAPGLDALAVAQGEWVARLEPGDALAPHALFALAEEVNRTPNLALLYTDSDVQDASGGVLPVFKPDWSPEWLRARDYIGRAAFFVTEGVRALGGWRPGTGDIAQHELLLRYTAELPAGRISHLPAVLLHCRAEREPTPEVVREGVRVGQASLDRMGALAFAEPGRRPGTYRIRYRVPTPPPLVSVVIPTRDRLALLKRCIQSVKETTAYRPLELILVDNQSRDRRTLAYLATLEAQDEARVLRYPYPFNYSAMNNVAAREARGDVLCLLNNDIEATEASWLTEMVGLALQPGVGAVGAKLLYPNNAVQHAGTVAGLFGVSAHAYMREPREADGYLFQLQTTREVAAVTAACMVLRRDRFLGVGGLDETELSVAFNDVDLCFKLLRAGYRNLWTPYAEVYHRESASRGKDESGADRQRFLREEAVMQLRWGALIARDPYYNPNLSLDSFVPGPAWPPRVCWPRPDE